jgi:signal-transduction protein with cAMP-binding, CBS, and nucleotidyltransferase domain
MMNQSGVSRLMVVENGRLVGLVTLKDLLDFFSLKVELEEQD